MGRVLYNGCAGMAGRYHTDKVQYLYNTRRRPFYDVFNLSSHIIYNLYNNIIQYACLNRITFTDVL